MTSALNPMPAARWEAPLKGLPFVSEVLLKIYRTVGINWERMGNVRFAVTCKNEGYMNAGDRAGQLAKEWSRAMHGPGVSDFVAVGDVQIKAIGADGQQMDSEVPVRQMLEQIVAKMGIPAVFAGAFVVLDGAHVEPAGGHADERADGVPQNFGAGGFEDLQNVAAAKWS